MFCHTQHLQAKHLPPKNRKKYGKYFILTAEEAVESKRKAVELKNERLKEARKKKRQQAKENKKYAQKKAAVRRKLSSSIQQTK